MKKTITSLALCGILLAAAAPAAFATELSLPVNTEGDIMFEVDNDPDTEIVVPNEEEEDPEIIELPGQGNSGSGAIRVEFVPNLRFGTSTNLTAGKDEVAVNTVKYNFAGTPGTKVDIAPFVQVRDGRGKVGADAKWILSVTATPFTANKGLANEDILKDVKIQFGGSKLTMDYGDSAKAGTLVKGQAANTLLATDGVTPIVVLETLPGQSTSGHRVSNVFDAGYTKGKAYADEKEPTMKFIKDSGQAPVADEQYTSTLKWTLTDGK